MIDSEENKKEKALRYNEGKLKWSLVHFKSLEPMVRVLMFGATKYAPYNWQKGLDKLEILESMQRHLIELIEYENRKKNGQPTEDINLDAESRLSHMGHIQCNAMFYNYFDNETIQSEG
jgi:hypothetical protein